MITLPPTEAARLLLSLPTVAHPMDMALPIPTPSNKAVRLPVTTNPALRWATTTSNNSRVLTPVAKAHILLSLARMVPLRATTSNQTTVVTAAAAVVPLVASAPVCSPVWHAAAVSTASSKLSAVQR